MENCFDLIVLTLRRQSAESVQLGITKKIQYIFLSTKSITLKRFIRKNNPLVNITPEHCFDVTSADLEQIINYDFMPLEAERWNDIIIFPGSQIWNNFLHNFFKTNTKKQKPRSFTAK